MVSVLGLIAVAWLLDVLGVFDSRKPDDSAQREKEARDELARQEVARRREVAALLARAEAEKRAQELERKAAIQREAKEVVAGILKKYDVAEPKVESVVVEPVHVSSPAPSVPEATQAANTVLEPDVPKVMRPAPVATRPATPITPPVQPAGGSAKVVQRAAPQVSLLGQLDMLLFDLDNTLLASEALEEFRGRQHLGEQDAAYIEALRHAAARMPVLISQSLLLTIQQRRPLLRFGILTRSPRAYAQTVLSTCFPCIGWDVVVAFEDTPDNRVKPHPDGVLLAARLTGIDDLTRVAVVGDDVTDLAAAYQAGALAVLSTLAWPQYWSRHAGEERTKRYAALGLVPDALLQHADDLLRFIDAPDSCLPALEAWQKANHGLDRSVAMRVEMRRHFLPVDGVRPSPYVEIYSLGRYFTATQASSRYNFSRRSALHPINVPLLDAKRGYPYPDAWADCCARYILDYVESLPGANLPLLVCAIPSSSQVRGAPGAERMVGLLGQIWDRVQPRPEIVLQGDVFEYSAGVMQNKHLHQQERLQNVREHLKVANTQHVTGRAVLVLDDIATSGATMYYASRYLHAAGAASVRCLALAHAVS